MTSRCGGVFSPVLKSFLSVLVVTSLLVVGACDSTVVPGEENSEDLAENDDDPDRPLGPDRYDHIEPLDIEEGEAKEGLHLRPGIELVRLGYGSDDPEVEVDFDEMVVEVSGGAREVIDDFGGIWSEDILLGDDFIFLFRDVREEGSKLIIEVDPFEFVRVMHGEWSMGFEMDPEEIAEHLGAYGMRTTMPDLFRDGAEGVTADDDEEGETNFGIDIGAFIGNSLKRDGAVDVEGSANIELDFGGEISIPVDWTGGSVFKGRISVPGIRVNTDYECEPYTETVTRRRGFLWHKKERVEREVQPTKFCVDYLLVKGTVGLNAAAYFYLMVEAEAKVSADEDASFFSMRAPLGTTGLALYLRPYVKVGVEASVTGMLNLLFNAETNIEVPFGFEYDPGDTGFSFLPNERHPVTRDGNVDVNLHGQVEAAADFYSELGVNLIISDAVSERGVRATGPKAGFKFGADLNYEPFQVVVEGTPEQPCVQAATYIEVFGDANLRAELMITERWTWGIDITNFDVATFRLNLDEWNSPGTQFCIPLGPEELEIRLMWQAETHLDLSVQTPNGNTIGPGNSEADGGTYHMVPASSAEPCLFDSTETCEAVVEWDGERPPVGEFEVHAINNGNPDPGSLDFPANFEIWVTSGDTLIMHETDAIMGVSGATSNVYTFTIGRL